MRSLFLTIVILCWFTPVWSVEVDVKHAPQPQLELNQLDAGWLSKVEGLGGADKQQFLAAIRSDIEGNLSRYSDIATDENATLVMELIKRLSEQYALPEYRAETVTMTQSHTIESWLAFFTKAAQLERDTVLMKEEVSRFQLMDGERGSLISKLLVDYRKLPAQTKARRLQALNIMRLQLEQLLSNERQRRLRSRIAQFENSYGLYQKQLDVAVVSLQPDPEQQQQRILRHQLVTDDINRINKALYQLELDRLGVSGDIEPLKMRLDELALSGQLIKQTIQLIVLGLMIDMEKSISGQRIPLPAPYEAEWARWQTQKTKFNRLFNDLFQQLDSSEQVLTNEQRSQAWAVLQGARENMQAGESRGREVAFLLTAYNRIATDQQVWWQRGLAYAGSWASSLWHVGGAAFNYPLFSINESPVTLLDLLWVLLVITVAIVFSAHVRKALTRFGESKKAVSEAALFTIGRILHYVIITAAVLIGFSTLGIDLSKLALVAGALSVGIGFGLQSIFNNFISGLILLFERPLKVGDLIELESGVRGRIKSINVRSTQITTWDNIDILVPNSEFISGRVTNYTFVDDLRRLHIPFGVAYGTDKELVKKAVLEAAEKVPFTLTSKDYLPDVWLINYGESSLDFELVVWVRGNKLPKRGNPIASYLWEIETALSQYGIEIPFPQRDLHVRSVDESVLAKL